MITDKRSLEVRGSDLAPVPPQAELIIDFLGGTIHKLVVDPILSRLAGLSSRLSTQDIKNDLE